PRDRRYRGWESRRRDRREGRPVRRCRDAQDRRLPGRARRRRPEPDVRMISSLLVLAALVQGSPPSVPSPSTLRTRWAAEVTPDRVLPEYPRPDLVRTSWINLNGP